MKQSVPPFDKKVNCQTVMVLNQPSEERPLNARARLDFFIFEARMRMRLREFLATADAALLGRLPRALPATDPSSRQASRYRERTPWSPRCVHYVRSGRILPKSQLHHIAQRLKIGQQYSIEATIPPLLPNRKNRAAFL